MNTADQEPRRDSSGGGSFWTSVPGILTGLATLVTAAAGVFGVIKATSDDGGDSNGGGASTEISEGDDGVTREEWAEQADAICVESNEQVNALGMPPQTPEEVVTFIEAAVPIVSDALEQFRSLTPPTGDEASVERMIGLSEQSLNSYKNAASSLRAGDLNTGYQLVEEASAADERSSEIARQLGAGECDAYSYS
jgi:hypothetical protein